MLLPFVQLASIEVTEELVVEPSLVSVACVPVPFLTAFGIADRTLQDLVARLPRELVATVPVRVAVCAKLV